MSRHYETYRIDWEGIALSVRWMPEWFGVRVHEIGHLEIESEDRQPLPVTETGYRSHFVHREYVEEAGGPVAYVRAWLDHEAQSESWTATSEARKQLSLF